MRGEEELHTGCAVLHRRAGTEGRRKVGVEAADAAPVGGTARTAGEAAAAQDNPEEVVAGPMEDSRRTGPAEARHRRTLGVVRLERDSGPGEAVRSSPDLAVEEVADTGPGRGIAPGGAGSDCPVGRRAAGRSLGRTF